MGNSVAPQQTSFNAGELSPLWSARVDMAKYGNGCFRMRNFLPLPQGPARRRSGSRYAVEVKNHAHRSWLMKFVFSKNDSYTLEVGDFYIRFNTGNGQLLLGSTPAAWSAVTAYTVGDLVSRLGVNYYCKVAHTNQQPPNATYWHALTGSIYEIPTPYAIADLTDTDGTFRLDMEQTGDVIFITHGSHAPMKLSRFAATRWTLAPCDIKGGPFVDQKPDQTTTVYASAETGTGITLTASTAIFTAGMVGTLFLLESKRIDGYAVWEVGKVVGVGVERRSDSNVYKSLNGATTGSIKPTHREGAKFDGDAAVQWEYLHSGYGIARITAIGGGGTTATADVVSRLPSQTVGVGNATTRWAPAAWRSDLGYPALVSIFRERLCFNRGQEAWGSVVGDFENFASRDGAETLPDSAFYITIGSSQTNAGVWMAAGDALLIGTRGAEFAVSEVTSTDVFGPGNIKASEVTRYGSRQVKPIRVGGSTLFAQRSGRRVRDLRPSASVIDGYEAVDLMVLSDHILRGQLIQMDFALEPHSIAWGCCQDGSLVGLTFLLEQDVIGWHPHPIGGGGIVESLQVIPAPDGTYDRVWMQVRRTINGQTKRYLEYFEKDWIADEQALSAAVFSDAALTFDGALTGVTATIQGGTTWAAGETGQVDLNFVPVAGDIGDYLILTAPDGAVAKVRVDSATDPANVTFITAIPASLRNVAVTNVRWARDEIAGIPYEGQEVTVLVDGAAHPRRTVVGNKITLQNPASIVQLGLPCNAELITMRIEGGSANGTAQGKMKRVHQSTFRVHETLGGRAGPEGAEDDFEYRSDADPMDAPPPYFTGDYTLPYPEGYTTAARIRVLCDQPLPFTLCGIYPRMVVEDKL